MNRLAPLALLCALVAVQISAESKRLAPAEELMAEAEELTDRGRLDAARDLWELVATQHPKQPEASTARLRLAQTERDLLQSLAHLNVIFRQHAESPEVEPGMALAGEIHILLGDYARAQAAYQLYLTWFPRGPSAGIAEDRLITSLIEIGRPDEALLAWEQAADHDPNRRSDVDALMQRCDALLATGDWAAAAEALLQICARFPNREQTRRARLAAGLCLEAQGKWHEAALHHELLLRQWPGSVEATLAGKRLDAVRRFEQALEAEIVPASPEESQVISAPPVDPAPGSYSLIP